jgi:uncharacterized protein
MFLWVMFSGGGAFPISSINATLSSIFVDNTLIMVEIADTVDERRAGLSGRKALAESGGMLFIMDGSDYYGIWMKNMNFPLDIIWIDENLKIVDIKQNIRPESYPEIIRPERKSSYILEVNAGFTEIYNIDVGDEVHL